MRELANDTSDSEQELLALEASMTKPYHGRYLLGIMLTMCSRGWTGIPLERRQAWAEECEELAFRLRRGRR